MIKQGFAIRHGVCVYRFKHLSHAGIVKRNALIFGIDLDEPWVSVSIDAYVKSQIRCIRKRMPDDLSDLDGQLSDPLFDVVHGLLRKCVAKCVGGRHRSSTLRDVGEKRMAARDLGHHSRYVPITVCIALYGDPEIKWSVVKTGQVYVRLDEISMRISPRSKYPS